VLHQVGAPLVLVGDLGPGGLHLLVRALDAVVAAAGCEQRERERRGDRKPGAGSGGHAVPSCVVAQLTLRLAAGSVARPGRTTAAAAGALAGRPSRRSPAEPI